MIVAAAVVPAAAAASFDPPDGTVINANLPSSVGLAYQIDLDALCGTGTSATVTAWLRDPAGTTRRVNASSGYGSLFEASFGAELSVYGTYAHWLDVACAAGPRRVEDGSFTVVGGDAGAQKARACADARRSLTKARKRYRRARRALERADDVAHRRAVRRKRGKLRNAKKRVRTTCPRR